MRNLLHAAVAIGALVLTGGAAGAQDPRGVAPNVFREVLNNPRVRILEANFRPGAKVAAHSHPEHVVYMLTDGTLIVRQAGKTPYDMAFTAGQALMLPAQTRAVENEGDKAVRALIVELKGPAASTRVAAAGKRAGRKVRKRRR
jgi:quercetin dioxygenase-like cupin family protein